MDDSKAIFIVKKRPYNHPAESQPVPVGAKVDLSHLQPHERQRMVDKGVMKPANKESLATLTPEEKPVAPKKNMYGLPFGQVPKKAKQQTADDGADTQAETPEDKGK